jgi:hypothetical protein
VSVATRLKWYQYNNLKLETDGNESRGYKENLDGGEIRRSRKLNKLRGLYEGSVDFTNAITTPKKKAVFKFSKEDKGVEGSTRVKDMHELFEKRYESEAKNKNDELSKAVTFSVNEYFTFNAEINLQTNDSPNKYKRKELGEKKKSEKILKIAKMLEQRLGGDTNDTKNNNSDKIMAKTTDNVTQYLMDKPVIRNKTKKSLNNNFLK